MMMTARNESPRNSRGRHASIARCLCPHRLDAGCAGRRACDAARPDPCCVAPNRCCRWLRPPVQVLPRWGGFYVGGHVGCGVGSMNFAKSTQPLIAHMLRELQVEVREQCLGLAKCSARAIRGPPARRLHRLQQPVGGRDPRRRLQLEHGQLSRSTAPDIADHAASPRRRAASPTTMTLTGNAASMQITDYGTLRARAGVELGQLPALCRHRRRSRTRRRLSLRYRARHRDRTQSDRPPRPDHHAVLLHRERDRSRRRDLRLVAERRPRRHADAERVPARRIRIRELPTDLEHQFEHQHRPRSASASSSDQRKQDSSPLMPASLRPP